MQPQRLSSRQPTHFARFWDRRPRKLNSAYITIGLTSIISIQTKKMKNDIILAAVGGQQNLDSIMVDGRSIAELQDHTRIMLDHVDLLKLEMKTELKRLQR